MSNEEESRPTTNEQSGPAINDNVETQVDIAPATPANESEHSIALSSKPATAEEKPPNDNQLENIENATADNIIDIPNSSSSNPDGGAVKISGDIEPVNETEVPPEAPAVETTGQNDSVQIKEHDETKGNQPTEDPPIVAEQTERTPEVSREEIEKLPSTDDASTNDESVHNEEDNVPFEPEVKDAYNERNSTSHMPRASIIKSDLRKWRNKKYLGGFRSRRTGVEFFHAEAQTTTPQEIQAMSRRLSYHRDTQTVYISNNTSQTLKENSSQMTKPGVYVGVEKDYYIKPRKYITAAEDHAMRVEKATIIQCFVRQAQARVMAKELRKARDEKIRAKLEKDRRRQQLIEKKRIADNERRLHPKTDKDFEILYSGLEHWRQQETTRINKLKLIEPARLAALADLLDQESALLQKIDKLKIEANEENKTKATIRLLEKMASPKKWLCRDGKIVQVDTPNIIRARELRDLYHALNFPLLTIDERLQILLHVKFTAKEFDCNLTREIVDLIDREGDLISRGRNERSLEGLRKRICNLFLQFIQSPEFNPEMASHIKLARLSNEPWKEAAVYYCRGCTKYKSSTEFYLSTTLTHLGKCKDCSMKENLSVQKTDDSTYGTMLKLIRLQESNKKKLMDQSEKLHALSLLQESDIRYLVDVIWNKKSAISGNKNIDDLILTRWDKNEELSPWNCVLLTKSEAITHDCQSHPDEIYSTEFRNKVFQKQLLARQHFGQLPAMAKYLSENYREEDGRLMPIHSITV
ncbi:hypothetical protein HDV04_004617 [Boothiomyces sp. JEL0838]|nr:hypothetical protein HDV04_004617 [Boothiomyces sp. JEL0838]